MKSYNTTNFTPNAFDNLYDNKNLYQYHTADIGDLLKKNSQDGTMSTFNNVIQTVDTINQDLANDLRSNKRIMDTLINKLVDINDEGKVELSNIAKDLSNKIVYIYDNLVTLINDQRSENLKLQLELAKATKEKNDIKHEVEVLTEAVRKLEVSLGVEQSGAFEAQLMFSQQQ
jgi:hypothetical protein